MGRRITRCYSMNPAERTKMDLINEEDMMDEQLQNNFLANGSTIEEKVDTAAEGSEEEGETEFNKT